MAEIVSYPSISGIMMSIRTSSTSGVRSSVSMPSRPFSAYRTGMPTRPRTWVSANTLRMSSSTINTRRPGRICPARPVCHASSLVGVGQESSASWAVEKNVSADSCSGADRGRSSGTGPVAE